jgi:hypothetical protein
LEIGEKCPFLKGIQLSDSGDCLEAIYRLSLIGQKLAGDISAGDRKTALTDVDAFATKLPSVLDTCNQPQWAQILRRDFPLNCLHAIEDLLTVIPLFLHHYAHFEWFVENYKTLVAPIYRVRLQCPFFY